MRRWVVAFVIAGCGSSVADPVDEGAGGTVEIGGGNTDTGGTTRTDAGVGGAKAGSFGSGGKTTLGTGGSQASGGSTATGGALGTGGAVGTGGGTAAGPVGVWEDVTPSGINLDPAAFGNNNYGLMDVVADPVRQTDLYAFTCYQGVWRSTDYGKTWTKSSAAGSVLETGRQWTAAIDPSTTRDPASAPTLYTANGYGAPNGFYKSTDWGVTWTAPSNPGDVYGLDIDPYDSLHMITGFHESNGIAESLDGGNTWRQIATPGSGNSIYAFFIDTGTAATTRTTWLEIPQDNSNGATNRTTNSGATWSQVGTFVHPHGACQIFNAGAGVVYAPGSGVQRSTDYGVTWTQVSSSWEACVTGTPSNLYTSSSVNYSPGPPALQDAPRNPGTAWSTMTIPAGMKHGAKRIAVTDDGSHQVVVSGNWMSGIWRYVQP
jgi:hypothetical protein